MGAVTSPPPTPSALDMQMPLNFGRLHFVGIGGIGMSGIAEILWNLGYAISGSDISENANITRLKNLGIHISTLHRVENVTGAKAVVISTAIDSDNIEYMQARRLRIPVVHRSEMLAEIMRLKISVAIGGTHGKTTTTSLIAHSLTRAKLHPTIINGGILNSLGTNAYLGAGKWLVAEADESDGTFTHLPATIVVITNMDLEHLDHYENFTSIKDAFRKFIENIPFYGCAIMCIDHQEVQKLSLNIIDRRIITYGLNPQADVRGENIRNTIQGTIFDVVIGKETIRDLFIALHGNYNIQNTLASIAVNVEAGINIDRIKELYINFKGVKRRFTKTGTFKQADVIDDYAHHPVEIKAVLEATRSIVQNKGKVIAIMQPHRHTRVKFLFEEFSTCFNDADYVFVTPIYAAGEEPDETIDHKALVQSITASGHHRVYAVENYEDMVEKVGKVSGPGDSIIFLGAGSITKWANALPSNHPSLSSGKARNCHSTGNPSDTPAGSSAGTNTGAIANIVLDDTGQ